MFFIVLVIHFLKNKQCTHVYFLLKKFNKTSMVNLEIKGQNKRGRPKKETNKYLKN